ncbi:osteopetrosis-associated transmembrane protein 1-like [Amphibalanus amphitrite]|uniref:osteopetrosis-associated transmembrane protein 1-like n=1 Tax=Amphibalanus amphitrite TaxID=1232801 RepID=UPI001C9147AB|nr:osteopetrosis-associated transmembrane protein 1-like [Amphibalanus amphitrite]XP_043235614.1 osteopetrosis-associated transmembrane protein 1-like [Amphibalanus amphitrite]XP_043235615.1 osteopetrosis-associated transmembrane protein 1-like [Amphibalanus amphitrite]XP_043235616.1 osteopetrosis-associated transmembrane protein 1-like [Amphibalanus amphitrite]XP_043235617.1 osteopetrosis-associated transmembrane protein 1-like [Amphibalanus amphitrite]XP_043235618.1 osteopetrosis-associated 
MVLLCGRFVVAALVLLVSPTACLSKDRDCDVPDSYHAEPSTSTKCTMELNNLADSLSGISRCMIMSARPLTACLSCYPLMSDLERAYTTIVGSGPDQSACAHELLDRDSTHMMLRAYAYYTELLAVSRCERCLERGTNGTYRLKDGVTRFMDTDAAFRRCMQLEFPAHKAVNASADMCDFCRPQYDMEQIHAKDIIKDTRDWQTCRDIIDMANTTQYMWEHYGCDVWVLTLERFLYSLIPLAISAVLIVSFYGYVWWRYQRLEREAAAREAERGARRPSVGKKEHLYDYSGLRRRPNKVAMRERAEREEREQREGRVEQAEDGESDESEETDAGDAGKEE